MVSRDVLYFAWHIQSILSVEGQKGIITIQQCSVEVFNKWLKQQQQKNLSNLLKLCMDVNVAI